MQLPHGNGRHRVYLSDYDYKMINMYGWYGQLFHFTSMACLKCSICALVLRLNDKKGIRIFIYTIIAGVLVTNMGVVVVLLAECRPAGFWRGPSAQCWPTKIRIYWIYATIAHSVLTDLILSFIPLTLIWKVNIPPQKKLLVMCLMSLGLVASAFGITRAAFLGVSNDDLSWTFCIVAIWSNLELFLGIVAANLALSRAVYLDLHGFWEQDVKTLGSIVRGQGDIRDIATDALPLWFAELDPSKMNFGVALYGRCYTVTDKSCNDLECSFMGPSKAGVCTNSDGAMSLVEIEQLIEKKGLTPKSLPVAILKQITWDDQ
ncbi:hypothetical protein CGCSCA5_v006824 [Colletotrichum siamense]|nr:hypothetical protein CGCSCA5_v006824 [Colletotrichum siamense]KAF4870388.1 hypothetical protein CGCSCA1_v010370 [Colletotrichum siamense]